jgi:hypothetical protein
MTRRSVNSDEVQASLICNDEVKVIVTFFILIRSVISLNLCWVSDGPGGFYVVILSSSWRNPRLFFKRAMVLSLHSLNRHFCLLFKAASLQHLTLVQYRLLDLT